MNYYTSVLKNYAVFDGRARRKEFWVFVLINAIIATVIGYISPTLGYVYNVAVLVPSLAVGARRLHDIGRSGWWLLLWLVPFIGWLVLLVFAVLDSQPGVNAYGPNPKGAPADMPPVAPSQPTPAA